MADKAISELVSAEQITATDMFVLEQNNTAKKLTGQTLLNWLVKVADGHGGIQSIAKQSTSGLKDTYRITLADTTTFDFVVTNGKSITSIANQSTSGLVDTYRITYNDGTYTTFPVTNGRGIKSWTESVSGLVHTYTITYNDDSTTTVDVTDGAKGDKGDNAYTWIKYASQKPTASSHNMSDIPDNWIGIYAGNSSTAPTDYTQYDWFQFKGEKGDTGDPATLNSSKAEYQVSDSGTIIPSGAWSASVPVVAQGKYLWTRTTISFNSGNPVAAYSVSRMGLDGSGSVSSVADISPNSNGNVPLTANDVGALPSSGGDVTGEIRMNGQPISGLNPPTEDTQAANKGYVDTQASKAAPVNLLDNSDFRNPVNQRGGSSKTGPTWSFILDRWYLSLDDGITATLTENGISCNGAYYIQQRFPLGYLDPDKAYTCVRYYADGTAEIGGSPNVSGDAFCYITISVPASAQPLAAVALYEGEYTADTLPKYRPKGIGTEFSACKRYYYEISGDPTLTGYISAAETRLLLDCQQAAEMRITPTVTHGVNCEVIQGGAYYPATIVSVEASGGALAVVVDYKGSAAPAARDSCCLYVMSNVALSAEL